MVSSREVIGLIHPILDALRDAKRLFGRLKHLRCKLPVLRHLLLTGGQNGSHLAARPYSGRCCPLRNLPSGFGVCDLLVLAGVL